ncbi:MAG: RIP metalloprotease RseP [Patescibacteria group bacterium]
MITLLIFLAILAILVLSHEFGHFVAARRSGMKVYEFGFGFPPRLFGIQLLKSRKPAKIGEIQETDIKIEDIKTADGQEVVTETVTTDTKTIVQTTKKWRFIWWNKDVVPEEGDSTLEHGTVYSFNLIPLGGFVRIKGEEGDETGPDSFNTQKTWKKAITLVAGVAMNVVLAAILLSIGFMTGIPQAVDDSTVGVRNRHVEIVQVLPGKPAELAGLKAGDEFLKIDNINSPSSKQLQDYLNANKDKNINVVVNRNGQLITKDIHPIIYPDTGKAGLGVSIVDVGVVGYPWYKAIYYGIITTGFYLKEIVLAFYGLIKGLFVGAPVGDAVSGPVGIAVMTGQVAKLGFAYLLNFTALLSLNLAIINILPIPALDGGRLLFLVINKFKRKQINPKHEQLAHTIGFALLMLLVVVVTVKDIGAFSGSIVNFFKNLF